MSPVLSSCLQLSVLYNTIICFLLSMFQKKNGVKNSYESVCDLIVRSVECYIDPV